MIDATFVPIATWPGKKTESWNRKKSPFDTGYMKTLDLLEKELRFLNAKDILIQAFFERKDIRNDGWPKANAKTKEPGVIVTYTVTTSSWSIPQQKHLKVSKVFSFPCDRFKDWEANLRAISLALEALRKVDRYGVTQSGEQYKGWEQFPPAEPEDRKFTPQEAAEFLGNFNGYSGSTILGNESLFRSAVREALLRTHPDKGGNAADFRNVQSARAVLENWHRTAR